VSDISNLIERLGRYGIAAQGQIAHGRSLGEITTYAAAAGAGLAMAGTADAAIHYSGILNTSIQINPAATASNGTNPFGRGTSLGVDLNGGGDDVLLRVNFGASFIPE